MQPHPIPNALGSPDEAPRIRPVRPSITVEPAEVVVTGVHLTFDNVLTLVLYVFVANLLLALICGLALYLLGVFS